MNGLQQAIGFIQEQQGCYTRHTTDEEAESTRNGKRRTAERGKSVFIGRRNQDRH